MTFERMPLTLLIELAQEERVSLAFAQAALTSGYVQRCSVDIYGM